MTRGPQWSPLSTSGATTATYGDQPLTMTEPQWSPLSTSGATTIGGAYVVDRAPPQWSPLSTSGATQPARRRRLWRAVAAMEPALDERGDPAVAHGSRQCLRPQWSPLSTSGATRVPPAPRSPSARRNGARSRRAGRRGDRAKVVTGLDAAMEPALDERGDANGRPRV